VALRTCISTFSKLGGGAVVVPNAQDRRCYGWMAALTGGCDQQAHAGTAAELIVGWAQRLK